MAVKPGPATMGKSIHKSKPTSALSKHQHVTKPESRHPTTHNYSVGSAESQVRKVIS